MSQDVSTNQGVREPLTVPPPIQPWSAEVEADKLMDELFSDIDRILDGGSKLPTEPVKPEYVSLKPIVIPKIIVPSAVIQPQELLQQLNPEVTDTTSIEPIETELVHTPSPQANRFSWSFEKLLLAVGLACLVVPLFLWLTSNQKRTWPWSQNPQTSSSVQNRQLSDSDAQFVSYMLKALGVIDHKTKAKQQTTPPPGGTGTPNLPTIPAPSNRTLNSNQAPTVLEKVYIPVPQAQAPLPPSVVPPAARSAVPAPVGVVRPTVRTPQARVVKPAVPAPSVSAKPATPNTSRATRPTVPVPSVAAKPSTPNTSRATRPTTLVPSVAAKPVAPPPTQTVVPPPPAPPPAPSAVEPSEAPAANHTLVGLVEIGDSPVALISVGGVVQRINVGETIGNSGWTLVSIGDQQAVIRRNGEVRSVYAGQKF